MKKIVLLSVLSYVLFNANLLSQTSEKKWMIGSSWAALKDNNTTSFGDNHPFDLDISIGYRMNNRFIVGLRPEGQFEKEHLHGWDAQGGFFLKDEKIQITTLGIGAFVRYNLPLSKKWQAFLDIAIGYEHIYVEDPGQDDYDYYTHQGLGINYFLSEMLALEMSFFFNGRNIVNDGPFNANGGYDLRVGCLYLL